VLPRKRLELRASCLTRPISFWLIVLVFCDGQDARRPNQPRMPIFHSGLNLSFVIHRQSGSDHPSFVISIERFCEKIL